ncbi:myoD family inhibitor domain-containing protein-like [Myripristis murdjan]|uniref:myoD family inhibitor domain-containing protein-like n=1 Tax=Myripristis murdjan TaxID=586833 RepID=UPI0011760280|nr:myoD family inhibitor domain-containing protein-like [Myripristis murdjan]
MSPADDSLLKGTQRPSEQTQAQPLPAAAPPVEASEGAVGFPRPPGDIQKPCLRCGCSLSPGVPEHTLSPLSPALVGLQGSSLSVQSSSSSSSKRRKGRDSLKSSHQPPATPHDSCLHMLLACLSCQCSLLLLGLLEACSSCLHTLCSSCCHGCARCCSALQDAPVEELNCHTHCHSVLFESCCEPTECLEFCLECCDICHHS